MLSKAWLENTRVPHPAQDTTSTGYHEEKTSCIGGTAGYLSLGPMAQCVVHALRSQKT